MNCGCWIISIGPGCTPWMIIAAISTADGAEPGMPSARQGIMCPGIDGHVAGLGGHQAVDRALAELLLLLAHAPWPRRTTSTTPASSPTPGSRPVNTPITPERSTVRQYCSDLAPARQHRVLEVHDLALDRVGQRRQHLGEAEGADQRRDQRDAAGELVPAEGEAVVGIETLLADLRDEEARAGPSASP